MEKKIKKALELFQNSLSKFIFNEWDYELIGTEERPILKIISEIEKTGQDSVRTIDLNIALWNEEPELLVGEHPDDTESVSMTDNNLFRHSLLLVLVELRVVLHELQNSQLQCDQVRSERDRLESLIKEVTKIISDVNLSNGR